MYINLFYILKLNFFILVFFFLLLVLLIIFLTIFLFFTTKSKLNTNSNENFEEVINDVKNIVKINFNNDKKIYAVLVYIFKNLNNYEVKTPITILLSGKQNNTNHFLEHFENLLTKHYKSKIGFPLDLSINLYQPKTRKELENNLFQYLQKSKTNRVVILRSIDNLQEQSPLFLHALSDPDTAPYKHLLVLLTISPLELNESLINNESQTLKKNCNERIAR